MYETVVEVVEDAIVMDVSVLVPIRVNSIFRI